MPVFQKIINFDQMFSQLKEPPVIVNELFSVSEEENMRIRDLIMTRYTSDMLSILPSCRCGSLKGEHVVNKQCDRCGQIVKSVIDEDIEPLVWFRVPEGVKALINPIIWIMLSNRFKKSGYNLIRWICDTTYHPNVKQPKIIETLIEMGIQRGYGYFVDNFDQIIDLLFSLKDFRLKRNQHDYLRDVLTDNRQSIFSQYLPLPNRILLVVEKTNVGVYIEDTVVDAIDAIEIIVGIDSPLAEQSPRTKENRTGKAIARLSEFYEDYFRANLSSKRGIYRKHVFGSRTHFAFRTVVTSITDDHKYDEIYIPWGVGLTAFRPHLMNKLMSRGYDHNQAAGFLYGHIEKYHPLLEELFNELLNESPTKSLNCILQRN